MARLMNLLPVAVLMVVLLVVFSAAGRLMQIDAQSDPGIPVVVHIEKGAGVNGRLLLPGGASTEVRARLDFELPEDGSDHWLLWLPHDPIDIVEVGGRRAAGEPWSASLPGFFDAERSEGYALAGYVIALPAGLHGSQSLQLHLRGEIRSAPEPRILTLEMALQSTAGEMILSTAIYAAWTTLLIAALALFWAVRDPLFMLYANYTLTALLFMATIDGQLYQLPLLGWLRVLGVPGFWAMMLAFNAIALSTLLQFSEAARSSLWWLRGSALLVPVMAALVPLALLAVVLPILQSGLQPLATLAWAISMSIGVAATLDGARRGVSMAAAVAAALLVLLLSSLAHEAMHRALLADSFLARHGYQLALAMMSVILFVGLSSRVGMVRRRLDDETLARLDSEQRLLHEQTRGGFLSVLQESLRNTPEDRIAHTAFRVLGGHVGRILGTGEVLVVGEHLHEQDHVFVQANAQSTSTARAVQASRALVRNHARNRDPVEVRFAGGQRDAPVAEADYLIVPMRATSPGWGALVAPNNGIRREQLRSVVELARITMVYIEDALAACRLRKTAEHDALTGTLNRRTLDLLVVRSFKASEQPGSLSVLFIDIDHFKRVNDTYGHPCGDECLRVVAAALRAGLRPDDVMGRYGGEEFLVLLPGQDAAAARIVAERLRESVERQEVRWQSEVLRLTVSIGLASRSERDLEPLGLLERADKALYRAKRGGRNCVCVAPVWIG